MNVFLIFLHFTSLPFFFWIIHGVLHCWLFSSVSNSLFLGWACYLLLSLMRGHWCSFFVLLLLLVGNKVLSLTDIILALGGFVTFSYLYLFYHFTINQVFFFMLSQLFVQQTTEVSHSYHLTSR